MTNFIDKIEKFKTTMDETQAKMQAQAAVLFQESIKEVFSLMPGVKGIYWTQYTPYFNDGEACLFNVNSVYYIMPKDPDASVKEMLDEHTIYDLEDNDEAFTQWDFKRNEPPEMYQVAGALESLLSKSESYLEATFGDHTSVLVTPDAVIVNEYHHD